MLKHRARLLTVVGIASLLNLASLAQQQPALTHHVPQIVKQGSAKSLGHVPADQKLRLILTLPLRDQAELESFIQSVSDPSSPSFHHYLTVAEFASRFGPSQEDYDTVANFAKTNGLEVIGISTNRLNVDVEGSVSKIENAFHLRMSIYQHPTESRTFYAPDQEPTPDLAVRLWHVSGLDNFSTPQPSLSKRPPEQPNSSPSAASGSGPSASFLGSDMRAAYYGSAALTGSGQSVGLLEFRGADLADLNTYFQNTGQTNNVPITLLSTDGTSTSCLYSSGCDDTEQILDMTQALGLAPGLSNLVMYVGSSDASLLNAMATTEPLSAQLSISWSWTPADPTTDDPYFFEFAAQGQSVFVATGDSGAWSSPTTSVFPADDPYVTSVGGTDLQTGSAAGPWSSESAWVDGGGGISPDFFPIPSWQTTAVNACPLCSTAYRNGPDVAANANWTFYVCANQTTCTANYWGGTSFAAPMWAGYLALANEQGVAQGNGTIGLLNPALYALAEESSYLTDFHDITNGSNGYAASSGYDLATGLGSPNGTALINALTLVPNFAIFFGTSSLAVAPGANGSTSVTTSAFGSFSSAIALAASGQPNGITVTFGSSSLPAPGNGSTTMTLAVGSTVAPGTYPITVTGTGGGVTQTVTVLLVVRAPTFSLSASPASVSVGRGTSGTSTITTAASYGFNSAVTLSASGQPTGVNVSFVPTSIGAPGNGSSQMTITVASTVATGTYPISVTGVGGGVTQTTAVKLVVVQPPDFSISTFPTQGQIIEGNSGSFSVSTNYSNGFDSAIALSASGLPAGDTITFSPATIPAPGYGSSTVNVAVGPNTPSGIYQLAIAGTGGGITHSVTYTLTIPTPDFNLFATLGGSVHLGGTDSFSVQVVGSNGFNSAIGLSVSGQPAGVTVAYNPASFPAPGNGEGSIVLSVASTAVPGTYPITLTATGGGVTHSMTANMTVLQPPNFSLTVLPATLSVYQGATAISTITSTVSGGFNSPIYLDAGGPLWFGINITFSPSPLPAAGSGTSTITIGVAPFVQPGKYIIPIGGDGGGINQNNAATISLTVLQAPSFGSTNVGSSATAIPFTFAFNSPVKLGSTSVITQGASTQDFTDAGTGSCAANTSYSQGQSCTINVAFSPKVPGARYGAAVIKDSSGNVIATDYMRGTGVGPELSFAVGTQATIPTSSLAGPAGIAIDSGGNIYITDTNNDRLLKETVTAGGYVESTVASDLLQPAGAAVDGAGNIYVADTKNNRILKEMPTLTGYSESVIASGWGYPLAVAVDSGGDVYFSNYNSVYEIANDGSYGEFSPWGNGFNNPSGLAVDGSGDIFVADTGNNAVKEVLASGSTVTLLSGLSSATGLALDGQENLYVSDTGNNRVLEILKAGGYTTVKTMPGDYSGPNGLAISGTGNLYVSNTGNNLVTLEDFADPPSLTFATTPLGTTSADSPKTVTLENIGNADLTFPNPLTGINPSITTNFTLDGNAPGACPVVGSAPSTPGTLASNISCALSISFTPTTAGSLSGSLVLTDNNLNAVAPRYATQGIALSGTTTQVPAAMTSPAPGSTLTGSSTTFTWTAGSGAAAYYLFVGTTPGGYDLVNIGPTAATSATVKLPTNGATIYVRLWSVISGTLEYNDYTYTEETFAAAAMTSPAPGSTLTGSSTTFTWTAGSGAAAYYLFVGTTPGGYDLVNIGPTAATSATVKLPTNGATIYVRLWSVISGTLEYNDYTYTEGTFAAAAMTSPAPGSTLTGSSTTFTWTAGSGAAAYYLFVGTTPGGYDLVNIGPTAATSATVKLPTNGATIYVRLWSVISGTLEYNDYTYTEETFAAAAMTSPAPGSTLTGSSTTFTWTAGSGAAAYYLFVGTTPGGYDLVNIGPTAATSATVKLPTNGATIYVRLWSVISGTLEYNDYTYTDFQ